jgi:bla regulator protein BlaR1
MMTTIFDLLADEWAQRLGWTLLHSFWQSLVIFSAVSLCLRLIPAQRSQLRYAVACTGLFLVVLASGVTFMSLETVVAPPAQLHGTGTAYINSTPNSTEEVSIVSQIFPAIPSFIDDHMPWVITAWITGFLFFALRLVLGVLYNEKLILSATPLENDWALYIKEAAAKLGINRVVSLAQSAAVCTPMVIGFFKPVILVPVGMLTGLSAEQLQTIFLHELAHIRRHDYLINIVQSFIEIVFFFNPFVWSISGIIRREREYCCDDLVVRQHGGVRAYAHALAQLAESSILTPALALPVAGSKNQLLNRIRRIMEKSVGNYSAKRRIMVPAILLLAGLFCISWLGIQQDTHTPDEIEATQDTIIDKKHNGARYSRRSIITIDENGQPHEEIIEEFEGDEELRPLLQKNMQSLQGVHSLMPPVPPSFDEPALSTPADTIPPPLNFRDHKKWEEFSRAFEERFREGFGDFFALRQGDLSEMLKELEEKFGSDEWSSRFHFDLPPMAFDSTQNFFDKESFRNLEQELQDLRSLNLERFEMMKDRFDRRNKSTDRYEDVLIEQLRKDSYLSEDETIESLEWNDEVLKVNGKKIKEADEEKYREINRKYFNRRPLKKFE